MIVVAQRVREARVRVDGATTGAVGTGLCLLACAVVDDDDDEVRWLAGKIAGLRVFPDTEGRGERSLLDVGGAALVVPQFTLAADWRKGRRPSYLRAAPPAEGERLVELLARALVDAGVPVQRGVFGADMSVELCNQGPFTLVLDSAVRRSPQARERGA